MLQENKFVCRRNSKGLVRLPDIKNRYFDPVKIFKNEFNLSAVKNTSYLMQIPKTPGNCGEATNIQVCFKEDIVTTGEDYDVMEFSLQECDTKCHTTARFLIKSSHIEPTQCVAKDDYRVCCPSLRNDKFRKVVNKFIGIIPYGNVSLYTYKKIFSTNSCCENNPFNLTGKCQCKFMVLFRFITGKCYKIPVYGSKQSYKHLKSLLHINS